MPMRTLFSAICLFFFVLSTTVIQANVYVPDDDQIEHLTSYNQSQYIAEEAIVVNAATEVSSTILYTATVFFIVHDHNIVKPGNSPPLIDPYNTKINKTPSEFTIGYKQRLWLKHLHFRCSNSIS